MMAYSNLNSKFMIKGLVSDHSLQELDETNIDVESLRK
jgi:hypothetical protein